MLQSGNNKPEITPVRSFFDDDDLTATFDFVYASSHHEKDLQSSAIIASTLSCHTPSSTYPSRGVYALHGQLLVLYRTKTANTAHAILELPNSRVQLLTPAEMNPNHGFRVTKNDISFEFYSPNKQTVESWMKALKRVCVLTSFHEEFVKVQSLGQGSFAKVFLMRSKITNNQYAVKGFSKKTIITSDKEKAKPILINEIEIMRSLDHENIIKLHEVHESDNSLYLVMELIKGKTLGEILKGTALGKKSLSDSKMKEMMRSIFNALAYMASEGIMHRDLKPSNILVENGDKIKIADFGLSTRVDLPQYIFKKCGTPGYLAPEVLSCDESNKSLIYDARCDVFSAGCIFYFMIFGFPLFNSTDFSEIVTMTRKYHMEYESLNIIRKEIRSSSSKLDKDALDLLLQLLDIDPNKRPTAAQALDHPYFALQSIQKIKDYTKRSVSTTISKSIVSGNLSPSAFGKNSQVQLIFPSPEGSCDSGTFLGPGANRFMEKHSLFLDLSKPSSNALSEENSNQCSANNSIGVDNEKSETNSHMNNSHLNTSWNPLKLNSPRKITHSKSPQNSEGSQFLKAGIYHNKMQKQQSSEDEDGYSLVKKQVKSKSQNEGLEEGSDTDDIGDENPQVQQKFDHLDQFARRRLPSYKVLPPNQNNYKVQKKYH